MVRIEMEESQDEVPSPPKASASASKTTDSNGGPSTSNASKVPSDGYETASDGELGDSGDENQEHPDQHPEQEERIATLSEDEIKEVFLPSSGLFLLLFFAFRLFLLLSAVSIIGVDMNDSILLAFVCILTFKVVRVLFFSFINFKFILCCLLLLTWTIMMF